MVALVTEPLTSGNSMDAFNPDTALADLFDAVHCAEPVAGHTHNFYRYPARFSPQFVRAAVEAFTKPGDTILDPFMGGGTALVEALAAGRRFIGCDFNPLAVFISRVKSTPLSRADIDLLANWADRLSLNINLHSPNTRHHLWFSYQRNLPWWLRKTLEMALDTLTELPKARQRRFARCTLLRTAQWALDCRSQIPSTSDFVAMHREQVSQMLDAVAAYGKTVRSAFPHSTLSWSCHRRLLCRSAAGLDLDARVPKDWLPPRLVLTSPPYVGVHVLYHRWQVRGRRETAAPYWLADCQDGHGGAHYTFGDRKRKDIETYMGQLQKCFRSVASLLDDRSLVVQLVAFSNPDKQLAPYLEALRAAGLTETDIYGFNGSLERVWRIVPNRKWYARVKGDLPARKEVLLFHRKREPEPLG
jgi:hypothetical protein